MKKTKWWLIAIITSLIIISAGWLMVVQLEGEKPVIAENVPEAIGNSQTFTLGISDKKSGLRKISAHLLKDGKKWDLLQENFEKAGFLKGGKIRETSIDIPLDINKLGIADGNAVFELMVWDYSWRNWWHGNKTHIEKTLLIDSKPPDIEILTKAHNINQGGSGVVVYRLSEACSKSGVMVGDNFFPGHSGYFKDDSIHLALFALDYSQGTGINIYIEAFDRAGNNARAGFYHHLRKKNFVKDSITLSDQFLSGKIPEFNVQLSEHSTNPLLDQFLVVNRNMREENEQYLKSFGSMTEPKMYWEGTFLRLPNSATRAGFADHREYIFKGEIVDHQVHLGIDLASLEKSPVPASNAGKVLFTGDIGIYGKTIVIDHGFGLISLYSHLSGIDVEAEQIVAKGEILGRTGVTGLAGGDHLHFGMMIHNTMINPIEWWDSNWIMHNVTDKLNDVKAFDRR
jgi:murein DD-endopeptidase MepM/ murein hydrolase activator NlpD